MSIFKNADIIAQIILFPDFSSKVIFTPSKPPSNDLIQLALMYGAKLRWLINSQPPEIKEMLISYSESVTDNWNTTHPGELSSNFKNDLKDHGLGVELTSTIPDGEIFTVKYFKKESSWGYIKSYLPKPRGMAINIAWHYIVLLEAIHSLLFERGEKVPQTQLMMFWNSEQLLDPSLDSQGLGVLKHLDKMAETAYLGGIHNKTIK